MHVDALYAKLAYTRDFARVEITRYLHLQTKKCFML